MPTKKQLMRRHYRRLLASMDSIRSGSVAEPSIEFSEFEDIAGGLASRSVCTTAPISVRIDTVDEQRRSVEAIIATNDPVAVFDWERFEVVDEVLVIEGMQRTDQVPLLNSHRRYDVDDVFGSIRNIQPDTSAGLVTGRLFFADIGTDDDEGKRIERSWRKVRDGHQREISAGYRAMQYEYLPAGQSKTIGGRRYTARNRTLKVTTQWALREGSLVPIGADPRATTRQESTTNGGDHVDKLRQYLQTIGLRSDASDSDVIGFWRNLGGEAREKADELATEEQQRALKKLDTPVEPPEQNQHEQPPKGERTEPRGPTAADERNRVIGIREICDGEFEEIEDKAVEEGWSLDKARAAVLKAIRERPEGSTSNLGIHSRSHESDCTVETIQAAFMLRTGLSLDNPAFNGRSARFVMRNDNTAARSMDPTWMFRPIDDAERQRVMERAHRYHDMSMVDICREAIRMSGQAVPHGRDDIIRRAASTLELSSIFTTSVNANVLAAYEEAGDTTIGWCSEVDRADFKTNDVIGVGKFNRLTKRPSGKQPEHLDVDDSVEQYKLAQYAGKFVVDEQDIINDSFGAINTESPRDMGAAARQLRPDLVYAILLSNDALNADSTALFHTNHANTGTAVLASAGLRTGLAAMMAHRIEGRPLNIRGRYLIVPPDLYFTALELVSSAEIRETTANTTRGTRNVIADMDLAVRSDARINATGVVDPADGSSQTGSATNWFIAARPGEGGTRTIEVGYLRGRGRAPRVTSFMHQNKLMMEWTVTMDIGAKAIDFRGLYRSTGGG